jgi:hypothetical protein
MWFKHRLSTVHVLTIPTLNCAATFLKVGAVVFVKRSQASAGTSDQGNAMYAGSFENPMYAAATSAPATNGGGGERGYMDVTPQHQHQHSGYMDVSAKGNGGSAGYMDVQPQPQAGGSIQDADESDEEV